MISNHGEDGDPSESIDTLDVIGYFLFFVKHNSE
jgi:hypothetical protein